MERPHTVTSSLSEQTGSTNEDKATIKNLRAALDAANAEIKRIRREKTYELKQLEEQQQNKLSVALKDQRCKLHKEKLKEWEHQKEALVKKYDMDAAKVSKLKDAESSRLRADLERLQGELKKSNKSTSGKARATFGGEGRQSREVTELREQKKQLEASLAAAREETRSKSTELLKMADKHHAEMEALRKESAAEVRKLLAELRSKTSEVSHIQKEADLKEQQLTFVKHEKEKLSAQQSPAKKKQGKISVEKNNPTNVSLSVNLNSKNEHPEKTFKSGNQVVALETKCTSLTENNQQLLDKIVILEGEVDTLQEENLRFLEQNEQLEAVHEGFEELIEELEAANQSLEKELYEKEDAISLEELDVESKSPHQMAQETVAIREKVQGLTEMVEALQAACAEKDRRIETISHRLRKHRNKHKVVRFLLPPSFNTDASGGMCSAVPPGLRETYFGYEEDQSSVDSSDMSACSQLSSANGNTSLGDTSLDSSFSEELGTEELTQNMRRLVREHLDLERAFSLLQAQKAKQQATIHDTKKKKVPTATLR